MSERLYDYIREFRSISIAGMCKNAGKTTALNSLIADATRDGVRLGLTSIGRDGESSDLVTGTGKPGIWLPSGSLFATATGLLRFCDTTLEVIETTGIPTPLGEVALLRALSDGNVQLAGPSMVDQLATVSALFRAAGAEQIIIDGAISRRTLCTRRLAEGAILCTGASHNHDINVVVEDTAFICELLTLPALEGAEMLYREGQTLLIGEQISILPPGESLAAALRESGDKGERIVAMGGALTDGIIKPVLACGLRDITFLVRDASQILLSGNVYYKSLERGYRFRVVEPIRLAALTVNPFSAYGYHFDKQEFQERMAARVSLPVINVEEEAYD